MKKLLTALAILYPLSAHAVPVISQASITNIGPVGATVTFKTDVASRGSLIYIPLGQTPNPNGTYPGLGTAIEASTGASPYTLAHTIVLNGLIAGATYTLSIRATDAANTLGYLNIDNAFRTLPKTDTVPPVISNIAVALTRTSIKVTFKTDEPSISVGLGYDVPGQPRLRFGIVNWYNRLYIPPTHTIDVGGLTPDTSYVYVLEATDLQFNKTRLAPVAFRTPK
jgi:hypothetical protein